MQNLREQAKSFFESQPASDLRAQSQAWLIVQTSK
jgi:hypothetical protein